MFKSITAGMVAILALAGSPAAHAADYPERPIRLIVPTSPGSTADVVARVVAERLGQSLKQTLVVENLAGAGGIPGTRQLVSGKPDGYTLAIISSNHAINPSLYKQIPYDSVKDITPISVLGTTPLAFVVGADSPYKTLQEFLDAARKAPGELNYGSSGVGTVLHLAGELMKSQADIDMMHIPYKGGTVLATDVMSGQVDAAFLAVPSIIGSVEGGKLRALAVSTPNRVDALPGVPTLSEAGVDGYAYDAWIALIGPAGLPADIVSTLQNAAQASMKDETLLKALNPQGFMAGGSSSQEAMKTLTDEIDRSATLVKGAGLTAQ